MNGSLPLLVWTQAFTHPARTRCGVMRHQARAMHHWRAGGQNSSAAAPAASPAPAATASPRRPNSLAMSPEGTASKARMPSSQRQFQASSAGPGRRSSRDRRFQAGHQAGVVRPVRAPGGHQRSPLHGQSGGAGVRAGQLRAEPVAADRGVVRQYVEPCVPVLTNKPAASLGNLPVPPAGFGVIRRVQPAPPRDGAGR